MSEPSIDYSAGIANWLSGRRDGHRLQWLTDRSDRTGREAPWRRNRPQQAPLKILFANKFFFLNGGSEVVMFDEMELMRKHSVDVLEFSMHDPRNLPSKYESYFVSQKDYRSTSPNTRIKSALAFIHSREAVKQITHLIRDEKPDLMHCHNIYHQLTPSIINAASRQAIPVVLTLHDFKPVCPIYSQLWNGELCTKCSDGRFEALLLQRCADGSIGRSALLWAEARYHAAAGSYQRVDMFVAPSRFMRDNVVGRLGEDKVVHIPNGIDTSRIQPSEHDEGFVLYLGRLSPEKGVETLLQAHAADNAAWRLVIAGSGPLLEDLRSRFPFAEFTGHLTGRALETRLRGASVVVMPSKARENCPLSILEAMAHAKPVVASRIGGIPELIRDGEAGFLFEPNDPQQLSNCIRTLLRDSDLRKKFGWRARHLAETEYSLERHGAALLSLYRSLTASPRTPSNVGS